VREDVRYPFGPVARRLPDRAEWVRSKDGSRRMADVTTVQQLASLLGVHASLVRRWRREGLNELWADRVACALGVHPWTLWGDRWFLPVWEERPGVAWEPGGTFCGRHPQYRERETA